MVLVVRQGHLNGLGGEPQEWKRRYFILTSNELRYYLETATVDDEPLGTLPLDGNASFALVPGEKNGHSNVFAITADLQTFFFSATDAQDREEWASSFRGILNPGATGVTATAALSPLGADDSFAQVDLSPARSASTSRSFATDFLVRISSLG